jgi:AhpD family alkylhydroperoxidase
LKENKANTSAKTHFYFHFATFFTKCLLRRKIKKMSETVDNFNAYRSAMNEKILAYDNKVIKRIYNLDTNTYAEGLLDVKTKELIGLTCSLVLRCDDCVRHHVEKCKNLGFSNDEIMEAMSVGVLIGGTIVIPHLRRAVEFMEACDN